MSSNTKQYIREYMRIRRMGPLATRSYVITRKAVQDNKCSICRAELIKDYLDHNHKTGQLRGLLCNKCNLGIGYFNDKPELLEKAVEYLKSW